ncbi:MAG: N-acetyltransferase [Actinobacteria bacterium]|nr:MAG: N-acetyltransferase [Actinomycetota bacterium]
MDEDHADDIDTPRGRIRILADASPELIASLRLDEGMGAFAAPNYPASREKKALERIARGDESRIILAHSEDGRIIGFVAIAPPSSAERWGKMSGKGLIEAMAIEVSKDWRGLGIANKMMEIGLRDRFFDDKIVICTGYAWHWDLESSGLDKESYRRMLLTYLGKAGFMYYETDEPNVNLDSANFFSARIGPSVDDDLFNHFEQLLYKDQAWADFRGRPRTMSEVLGTGGAAWGGRKEG